MNVDMKALSVQLDIYPSRKARGKPINALQAALERASSQTAF